MTLRTTTAATLTAGALALTMSACGEAKPSADKLSTTVKKNSTEAKTTALDIEGTANGTKAKFGVHGTLSGSNQEQVQTQGKASSAGLIIDKKAYLKGNADFWREIRMPDAMAKKLDGKWWAAAPTPSQADPALDVKKLLNDFFASTDGKKLSSKDAQVTESTTDGQDTYTVSDPKKKTGVKLITTRGDDAKVVKIVDYRTAQDKSKATYTFSKWNGVETFKAPAGAKPITSVMGGPAASK